MRDRLIELLQKEFYGEYDFAAHIADHLIANGVIVLPCKVGEVLYDATEFLDGTRYPEMYLMIDDKIIVEKKEGREYVFTYDGAYLSHEEIGKTVFLTKEDAEAALQKGGAE